MNSKSTKLGNLLYSVAERWLGDWLDKSEDDVEDNAELNVGEGKGIMGEGIGIA